MKLPLMDYMLYAPTGEIPDSLLVIEAKSSKCHIVLTSNSRAHTFKSHFEKDQQKEL